MRFVSRWTYLVVACVCLSSVAGILNGIRAYGAETGQDAKAAASDNQAREEALKWLDGFRGETVLFHDKDIQQVRDRLSKATPEQAKEWLTKTAEMRQALDSPEWQETRRWFKEFLKVQAMYTEEQIEQLRQETRKSAEEGTPAKFIDILKEIENKRSQLVRGAANSAKMREHKLTLVEAYRKESMEQREAARRAAAAQSAAASSARQPAVQRRQYNRPSQLVNSLDVARWSVMRDFWPRW